MKKLLLMGLMLCIIQAKAQETPIQRQINTTPHDQFLKQSLFSLIKTNAGSIPNYVTDYTLLGIDNTILNRMLNTAMPAVELDIFMSGKPATLQLLRKADQENIFKINNGELVVGEQHACYYGVIKDQLNSFVVLSLFKNNLVGTISNATGNYSLVKKDAKNARSNEYMLYYEKELLIKRNFTCGTDLKPKTANQPTVSSVAGTSFNCVSLYLELDYPLFQKMGNLTNAQSYANVMKDGLELIFFNESMKVTVMTPIKIYTTLGGAGGDPYGSINSVFSLAAAFKTSIGSFGGHLAHLLSGRAMTDATGYGPGLYCQPDKTSVSTSMGKLVYAPVYAPLVSEIALAAHEIGHTMSGTNFIPHTQACYWNGNNTPIDGCAGLEGCGLGTINPGLPATGGTIMSYCDGQNVGGVGINLSNGFGIQPGNLIRIETANASCLASCPSTCNSNVVISGSYFFTPVTESSTWIITSGTTKILGGVVKLDADATGYVELNPGFEATPLSGGGYNSIFVAKASNGCSTGVPSFTSKSGNYFTDKNDMEKSDRSFLIYPNPATDYFTVIADVDITNAAIELFDMSGKLQHVTIKSLSKNSRKVRTENLSKGMYILKLTTGTRTEFAKIIIQ